MVELINRRIVIDGKPTLVFAGEIHYFRLKKADWEDRVKKLKAMGCNAVASYIPWIVHEEREGQIDVTGSQRPENDVAAFIDLCHRHGLWFIARPGPFVMAEMKNEGIPYWVYKKHPDAVPITWEGEKARSKTLDYLNPGYLSAAKRWYAGIMPVLASRLQSHGGPVIAVQLDNEIGMLSWVNNQPDLTEQNLCDLSAWLGMKYTPEELKSRYPFDLNDPAPRTKAIRNPDDSFAGNLHQDYGHFERHRTARYVATLREYSEAFGVKAIPFLVNIHGSGGGRGIPFPIGIHQLFESYTQAPGYLAGSDHYLGELTRENAPDLYVINAFMAAVNRPEQPTSSLEFEVGTGDYGDSALRQSGRSGELKVRMSLAQGNRLLNYYLLTGGINPPLLGPVGDGNDRIAFTGERHGFAAPISPEGVLDPTYFALKRTTEAMLAIAPKLADMDEEHDGLALGFIPDYYITDFFRPGLMRQIVEGLEWTRGPLDLLSRALVLNGFRFPAVDVQNRILDPQKTPVLALSLARYTQASVQKKLADYVLAGGHLFGFGDFPTHTGEGKPCTILADALGLDLGPVHESNGNFHVSTVPQGWAKGQPEVRVHRAQTFGPRAGVPFFRIKGTQDPAGIEVSAGRGKATLLAANFPTHLAFFREALGRLGAKPGLEHDSSFGGIQMTTVRNAEGERFLSVMNLDLEPKLLGLRLNGAAVLGGNKVPLGPKEARFLPMDVDFGGMHVIYSTTELAGYDKREVRFLRTGTPETVLVRGTGFAVRNGKSSEVGENTRVVLQPGTGACSIRKV